MGFYNSLSSRFVVALGKNSAKKRLKKKGASSRMLNSNRAIIRSQHPPSGDYWTLIVSEYMRHVDYIMFLFLLTIKPTSIQFAEGKDSVVLSIRNKINTENTKIGSQDLINRQNPILAIL